MSRLPKAIALEARAKVNLFLEVIGRRTNGYHDIRSLVVPVSLADRVTLEPTDGAVESSMTGGALPDHSVALLPSSDQNLTTRAALALKKQTGYSGGVRIHVEKHIPIGGGLGGGSADGAAVLCGLNTLWQTGLSRQALMDLGAELGCDIPALVHGGAVLVEGLGERVSPVPAATPGQERAWWMVLANPGFGVPTADVYARYKAPLTPGDEAYKSMVSALMEGNVFRAAPALFNGLEKTVLTKYPLIGILRDELKAAGAIGVLMSGSGASVFGLARDEGHARHMADQVRRCPDYPFWAMAVQTVPDGVMAAHGPLEARV